MDALKTRPIISVSGLNKSFGEGTERQVIFADFSLEIAAGTFTAIVGKSGSGKSTLLHILAGLEPADSGKISVCEKNILGAGSEELADFRLHYIGLVFQFFNLLPTLTLQENIALPSYLAGKAKDEADALARKLLAEVDLADRARRLPHEVSGGEIQRAAIARALINQPSLILADEPSGNLDPANGERVLALFVELTKKRGGTLVVVTHDHSIAERADSIVQLGAERRQ